MLMQVFAGVGAMMLFLLICVIVVLCRMCDRMDDLEERAAKQRWGAS